VDAYEIPLVMCIEGKPEGLALRDWNGPTCELVNFRQLQKALLFIRAWWTFEQLGTCPKTQRHHICLRELQVSSRKFII